MKKIIIKNGDKTRKKITIVPSKWKKNVKIDKKILSKFSNFFLQKMKKTSFLT